MIRLVLLAHAPTQAQRELRFPSFDDAVEPVGASAVVRLSAGLAAQLRDAPTVLRGPERRCAETAAALGFGVASECAELRAWDAGRWAGLPVVQVAAQNPDGVRAWHADPGFAPPDGESLNGLIERVAGWMRAQEPLNGRVLVVADPSVVRAAVVVALGAGPATFWRIEARPLAISVVQHAQGEWRLRVLGLEASDPFYDAALPDATPE